MTDQTTDHTDQITVDLLRQFAKQEGQPGDGTAWVSIAMPTHRTGAEVRQDPIRFRNLASDALAALADLDVDAATQQAIETELEEVAADHDFWRRQTGGLVMFTNGVEHHFLRLPSAVAEQAVVGHGPALAALVPHLADDSRFRVLQLSADSVRLFEGTINSLAEVELGPIPADYEEAFSHLEHQKQLQHSTHPDGSQYHGHGAGSSASDNATTRYLRAVAGGLDERLRSEPTAPLVLAGVPQITNEFRQISGHQQLLDESLGGSHDRTPAHELHPEAWRIVRDAHAVPLDVANDRIEQAWAQDQALLDVAEILRAAEQGRVDTLFIGAAAAVDEPQIEEAVRLTLQMGGEVHALADSERRIAALLRY